MFIFRTVNFSRKFGVHDIHLYRYITTSLNYSYIKILNINYIYWISIQELRRLIKKLENLESLYAIGTKLGIKYKDINEYTKVSYYLIS